MTGVYPAPGWMRIKERRDHFHCWSQLTDGKVGSVQRSPPSYRQLIPRHALASTLAMTPERSRGWAVGGCSARGDLGDEGVQLLEVRLLRLRLFSVGGQFVVQRVELG